MLVDMLLVQDMLQLMFDLDENIFQTKRKQ